MINRQAIMVALNAIKPEYKELLLPCVASLIKLSNGAAKPISKAQARFLTVVRGSAMPETPYEVAFMAFKAAYDRGSIASYSQSIEDKYGIPEYEDGYPRPGFKPLNRHE